MTTVRQSIRPRSTMKRPAPRVQASGTMRLRVVVADDHELMRDGVRAVLQRIPGIEVVGEASNGRTALERCEALRPDVLLLDLSMPDVDGFELLKEVRRSLPDMRPIVLSMHSTEESVREALSLGAAGYVVKDSASEELELALRAISRGALYLSSAVSRHILTLGSPVADPSPRATPSRATPPLTPRQREILTLIASGMTTQAIAHHLAISVKTAETHRSQLMDRLGIHEVAGLVRFAIREGLITSD